MNFADIFFNLTAIRIIDYLCLVKETNISDLTEMCMTNHVTIKQTVEQLIKKDILKEKRYGRIRILRLNDLNVSVKAILATCELFKNPKSDMEWRSWNEADSNEI